MIISSTEEMYELGRKQSHFKGIKSVLGTQREEQKPGLGWEEPEWGMEEG